MFLKAWSKFSKSEFTKNVSSQILGTGLAQALPFLATPLLTRLFTEEDWAVYTSFFAVASIFAVAVGGKYHMAIVLPKAEEDTRKLFALSVYLTLAYALAIALILPYFQRLFPDTLENVLYYVPLYVLFFGIWTAFINVSIRHKTFAVNAFAKVLQAIGYIVTAIGLGFTKIMAFGLVIAKILGTVISWVFLSSKSPMKFELLPFKSLKEVAETYIDYPKYGIWPSFLNTISLQAMVLILTQFYITKYLGYFGLTFTVLSAPLALIGASYKDVFYQKIATLMKESRYKEAMSFFNKSAVALFVMGIPICIVLILFGEPLFGFVFGDKWGRSGQFASILAFSFIAKLIQVVQGEVLDVIVDMRKDSATFGQHLSFVLSDSNRKSIFIPKGMAHGFLARSEEVIFSYKCDAYYNQASERGIVYNDQTLDIDWDYPIENIILSQKGTELPTFKEWCS